jgi:hypothetical protein
VIRFKNQIRLHPADIERIAKLTGSSPSGIQTVNEFNAWIDRHLEMEKYGTPESQLIALLLQDEKLDSEL